MLFFKLVSLFGMTLGGSWACSYVDFHKKLFKKDGKGCWKLVMIGYWKSVVPTSILSIPFTQLIELIDAQLFSSFLLSDKVCHFLLSRRCSLDVRKCLVIGLLASELLGVILRWGRVLRWSKILRWRFGASIRNFPNQNAWGRNQGLCT